MATNATTKVRITPIGLALPGSAEAGTASSGGVDAAGSATTPTSYSE